MTINHPEGPSKTDNMPDHEYVAVPDEEFKYDKERGLSTQRAAELAKKNKLGHMGRGVIAIVGIGVAAGVWVGFSGDDENKAPRQEPVATAPANPSESEAPIEQENTTSEVITRLSAEQYTGGDSLVRGFNDLENQWMMSGATLENFKMWDSREYNAQEYTDKIVAETSPAYIDALFVDNWEENPNLQTFVEDLTGIHHAAVGINLLTTESYNDEDLEPYALGRDVTEVNVISESSEEMVVAYRYERYDNSDMNRGETISTEPIDGQVGGRTLTWTNVDGEWKISDMQ